MSPQKKSAKKSAKKSKGFTAEERAAMREYVQEMKGAGEGESAVLAKIATFKGSDRTMAERIHAIVKTSAPELEPKTWYGMPAYAKDDKVICFFQAAAKFKARYATLGFNDRARLDDGTMWPVAFALKELTPSDEGRIVALVKKATREA